MGNTTSYPNRFVQGVKLWMAENDIITIKDAADEMGVGYMALYKIMDGSNRPTAEMGILLCSVAGFSANWLFLGIGAHKLEEQATMNKMLKEIKLIRNGNR